MRRKLLLISCIVAVGLFGLVGCGKKSASSEVTTETTSESSEVTTEEDATQEEASTVATEETEATTAVQADAAESTATKEDEKNVTSATGTYNGFADTNSVEIQLSDGSYQNFFVEEEDVMDALNNIKEGSKVSFTYSPLEGQANNQLLSIKKK